MKDIRDFVVSEDKNIEEIIEKYNFAKGYINVCDLHIYYYNGWIESTHERIENQQFFPQELTIEDKDNIYRTLTNPRISKYIKEKIPFIDYDKIIQMIISEFNELREALSMQEKKDDYLKEIGQLLDMITFEKMHSNQCTDKSHLLIGDETITCPCCNCSTSDYELSKKQLDFLKECAVMKRQAVLEDKEKQEKALSFIKEVNSKK